MASPPSPFDAHTDRLWYRDAIIYQLHVKAFFDTNADGIGDFPGLTTRLDYLRDLGVNTLWLLPFYPSPMRDDGYDIADYRSIHPGYGRLRDFRQFVREAHRRGMRVITELVINHTSDEHRWFQQARRAAPGSARRNYYVWSDSDQKWRDTRIIFTDTESSNWAWDPVARSYYWHRFFAHQPDLNFNNPQVVRAVKGVMRFWLDMGVDGLRLDAIPYLCERDGTSNENLPETHEVVRDLRAFVDRHYGDRMLLAEANQWPEDVREYFGQGDECHMAYHFPLMPRMYMAVALEDRHPIVDIMRQTPAIPGSCQWAIFLRNHDELTLEMVTDRERDYMYRQYATDPRMRVNVGIRRRLAPLMENDLGRIRLMNSLLMSMPGSPIVYYGDEIGMGDNIFLGDRDGVRTPMQWSPDRNAGFSRADPQRLYLPPIMDPVYGYESVNVESQSRDPSSQLNWMRRLIGVRREHPAFGRGSIEFLRPGNRKVLAYLRSYEDDVILCVANLARSAQPVELDLRAFNGRVPVELMGSTSFPPVGELPYLLTLPGYGVYWFRLATEAEVPPWHEAWIRPSEMPALVLAEGWQTFFPDEVAPARRGLAEHLREQLEQEVLPPFLTAQRWFGAKHKTMRSVTLKHLQEWSRDGGRWLLGIVDVQLDDGVSERYFVPLTLAWGEDEERASRLRSVTLASVRHHSRLGILYNAFADAAFCLALVDAMAAAETVPFGAGQLRFSRTSALDRLAAHASPEPGLRRPHVEGSNSVVIIDDRVLLKGLRRLHAGSNSELEVGRFLTERVPCDHIVPVAGALESIAADGTPTVLALLQGYVENQGDAWTWTVEYFVHDLEHERLQARVEHRHEGFIERIRRLGARTAALHLALAQHTGDAGFDPELATNADFDCWAANLESEAGRTLVMLESALDMLSPAARPLAENLLEAGPQLARRARALLPGHGTLPLTRHHGDFHLGQVLLVNDDFVIIDFEGEPLRSNEQRRRKHSPLRDVGGLLRSFDYAAQTALRRVQSGVTHDTERLAAHARHRLRQIEAALLNAYFAAMSALPGFPARSTATRVVRFFAVEKAFYEVRYELGNRPDWLDIPLAGVLALLQETPMHAPLPAHAQRRERATAETVG